MFCSTKRLYFGDYSFCVCENVYEPAEDSFIFGENLDVKEDERVLDMGTGCGILGILAAKKACSVVAVDVNPYAVRCARENAMLNNVNGKLSFLQGDLFASLREAKEFDLILFNAPYLPTEESKTDSWIDLAWAGGATGRQIIDRFISEAPRHLNQTGRVLLMQSTLAGVNDTLRRFVECRMHARVVAESALSFFEVIVLIEAKT